MALKSMACRRTTLTTHVSRATAVNPLIAHRFLAGEPLLEAERRQLLEIARRLRAEATNGQPSLPLAGRHVALVMAGADSRGARLVEEAAGGLGAQVSHIDPIALGTGQVRAAIAKLLGSLYDAVDCDDLPAEAALTLERLLDMPMFRGLGGESHPIRQLLPALRGQGDVGAATDDEPIIRLIQAVLVDCIR
jgi:ornithine carbamoyltransferase